MKSGYYTDKQGNVIGYFELENVPENSENTIWVESESKPELHTPPLTKEQLISRERNFLSSTDYKIIRQLEQNTSSTEDYARLISDRQAARNRINELEAALNAGA